MINPTNTDLSKGLNKDYQDIQTDPQSVTFALNAIRSSHQGGSYSYSSEPGNTECFSKEGYTVVGSIYGDDNEVFIFLTDGINHEIGILKNCKYETVVNNTCFNFDPLYPITGEYRIRRGCERVLYWRDSLNKDKRLNVDKYLRDVECKEFDCNDFNLNPNLKTPNIDLVQVNNSGGRLPLGSYRFQVEILDSSLNVISKSYISPSVPIYNDSTKAPYPTIDGGYNIEQYDAQIGGIPLTNKSITIRIENLDESFEFVRVNVIRSITGDGITSDAHAVGNLLTINSSELTFTYTGLNVTEGDFFVTKESILTDVVRYDTSTAMEQVQGRLLRVGVTESVRDFSNYQKFASKIGTNYEIRRFSNNRITRGNAKDPNTYWDLMSFMGDEIYGIGIVYVHTDGYESPVFHIPGRPMNLNPINCEALPFDNNNPGGGSQNNESCIRVTASSGCFGQPITWSITYFIGNIPYVESGSTMGGEINELFCHPYNPDVFVTEWTVNIPQGCNSDINYEIIQPTVDEYNNILPEPTSGWDNSLIEKEDKDNFLDREAFRWEVYNTAYKLTSNTGVMAYTQTDTLYEKPSDCCVGDYWGVDICGNSLQGTNVRHHRFPSRRLECIQDGPTSSLLRAIGINFFNLEYPSADVCGHYFVRVKRDDLNKTVLDQGIVRQLTTKDTGFHNYEGFTYFNNSSTSKNNWLLSPRYLYNKEFIDADYIHFTRGYQGLEKTHYCKEFDGDGTWVGGEVDTILMTRRLDYTEGCVITEVPILPKKQNFQVSNAISLDPTKYSDIFQADKRIINPSLSNPVQIIQTSEFLPIPTEHIPVVSLKKNIIPYRNLDSLQYVRMHSGTLTLTSDNTIWGGDAFLVPFNILNTLYRGFHNSFVDNFIRTAIYVQLIGLSAALTILTGGAATPILIAAIAAAAYQISKESYDYLHSLYKSEGLQDLVDIGSNNSAFGCIGDDTIFGGESDYVGYYTEYLNGVWLETDVNIALRHGTIDSCFSYFNDLTDLKSYVNNKIMYLDEESGKMNPKPILCPEFYELNKDFNILSCDNTYYPITRTYDFCRNCKGVFDNRIIYSEVSTSNSLQDNYSYNKANSFLDLPSHRGPITGLKFKNNKLLVHQKQASVLLQTNPSQIQTDQATLYVGTGEFLGIPPYELNETDTGYAGSQSILAYTNSEYGYSCIDQDRGEVFIWNSQLNPLSMKGMSQWFKENLPSKLKRRFDMLGIKYPFRNDVLGCKGTSLQSTYDSRFKRLIIHKKDFDFVNPDKFKSILASSDPTLSHGDFTYSPGTNRWVAYNAGTNGVDEITFGDSNYFTNESWTISYSFLYDSWTSFHSYLPQYMFNDQNHYYTVNCCDNKIYKHEHVSNYHQYYNQKYPFMVEWVSSDYNTEDFHTIHYVGTPTKYDVGSQKFISVPNKTFNQAIFYNDCETSGLLNLKYIDQHLDPYGNISLLESEKSVILTDENYKISGIRDVSTSNLIETCAFDNKKSYYTNCNGYIDSVPINFDYAKEPYQLKSLNGKYIISRLIYNPNEEDIKQTLNVAITNQFNSIR